MSPARGNEQVRPSPETDAETTRSIRSTLFEKAQLGPDWEDESAGSPRTKPKSLVLKDFTRKPFRPKDLAEIFS
jgi:nitrate reductase beta subunit